MKAELPSAVLLCREAPPTLESESAGAPAGLRSELPGSASAAPSVCRAADSRLWVCCRPRRGAYAREAWGPDCVSRREQWRGTRQVTLGFRISRLHCPGCSLPLSVGELKIMDVASEDSMHQ